MSKSTTLICDCGCRKKANQHDHQGWLTLSQIPQTNKSADPKLERELHFSSFECLDKWSHLAVTIIPELQSAAKGLSPRGDFSNDSVPGLYV